MNKDDIRLFFSQLLELSLGGIIPSIICAAICLLNPTFSIVVICGIISSFVTLGWTLYLLFDFRMTVEGKKLFYYFNLSTLAVYFSLGVGSSVYLYLMGYTQNSIFSKIHTFLFFNFKFLHYISYDVINGYRIDIVRSSIYYALIYIAIILLFPLITKEDKIDDENLEEEIGTQL